MNCEEFKKLIVSLVYDELSEMEVKVIQKHLNECQECAKFKAEIEQTSNLLESWVDRDIPADLANIHSQVERKYAKPSHEAGPIIARLPWQKRWFAWPATAFGIVAILLAVFGLIGTEIKWEQNTLTVSFGENPDTQNESNFSFEKKSSIIRNTEEFLKDELMSTALLQAQYQNVKTELSEELQIAMAQLSQVLLEHQESQKVQLSMLIEAIQAQRNSDMELIKEEIQNVANAVDDELQKTYLTLDLLISAQANVQESETDKSKSNL